MAEKGEGEEDRGKRNDRGGDGPPSLPVHLQQHERNQLLVNPEVIYPPSLCLSASLSLSHSLALSLPVSHSPSLCLFPFLTPLLPPSLPVSHSPLSLCLPGWKGARDYAQFRGISAVFRVITHQSRVVFSRVFAFSRPNTVRTRVISPIDGRETARKRSDNINTFYVLFAPAREFIRETA